MMRKTEPTSRVETLTQVPQAELNSVLRDFKNSGAKVTVEDDSQGTFTVIANFSSGSFYQASGVRSL